MLSFTNMWLVYALTTVVFYTGLDFFIKKSVGKIDDHLGAVILNIFAVLPPVVVLIWLKLTNQETLFTKEGGFFAMLAGLSIGIGTITMLRMFSLGTNLSLGSPVVRIGTVILATLVGTLFLKEVLTIRQVVGIVLAVAGLGLVIFK